MPASSKSTYIVGCGYTGTILARQLREEKRPVVALRRDAAAAAGLSGLGIDARPVDLDRIEAGAFEEVDGASVLYLVPPPREGRDDPRLGSWLEAMGDARPGRVVYASTSGVYGDRGGRWIDEEVEPAPETDRAHRRVAAEERLRAWCAVREVRLVVLRIAGIYGPGKLPLDRIRSGEPVLRAEDCPWTNLIHSHDVARAYRASIDGDPPFDVFNLASGRPVKMADYFDVVADGTGLARPPKLPRAEAEERLRPGFLAFLRESRRLDVSRLTEHLAPPRFVELAEGVAHALGEGLDDAG